MSCPDGGQIDVTTAQYGRFGAETCGKAPSFKTVCENKKKKHWKLFQNCKFDFYPANRINQFLFSQVQIQKNVQCDRVERRIW